MIVSRHSKTLEKAEELGNKLREEPRAAVFPTLDDKTSAPKPPNNWLLVIQGEPVKPNKTQTDHGYPTARGTFDDVYLKSLRLNEVNVPASPQWATAMLAHQFRPPATISVYHSISVYEPCCHCAGRIGLRSRELLVEGTANALLA
ncbi:hypothetical protein AB1N83_007183 [Pleurotus pulmonarius]